MHKSVKDKQNSLFEVGEWWEEAWQGMPEFIQEDLEPFKTVYVHFKNRKDMDKFAKLVDQNLTTKTQSIWYPETEIVSYKDKRYISIEEEK